MRAKPDYIPQPKKEDFHSKEEFSAACSKIYEKNRELQQTWRKEQEDAVVAALEAAGIKMDVWGCGCCESPWMKMEKDGELIADFTDVDIKMLEDEDE